MYEGPLRGPFLYLITQQSLMERVAVFVDAGYLFAQGSHLLAGRKLPRSEAVLNYEKVVECLSQFAERVSDAKLLRIYWYDGTSTGPTPQHIALAYLPGVKVRLGFVNSVGEQKGVDSLIVTDMIALARNRAMSEAVLLSGDEDLRVGVQQAQELGVRVHLLGFKPSRGSQSVFLLQEADSTHEWAESELAPFLSCRAKPEEDDKPKAPLTPSDGQIDVSLAEVGVAVANEVLIGELETLLASVAATGQIPKLLDGRLLGKSRNALGADLDNNQKKSVRKAFIAACENRLAAFAVSQVLPPSS